MHKLADYRMGSACRVSDNKVEVLLGETSTSTIGVHDRDPVLFPQKCVLDSNTDTSAIPRHSVSQTQPGSQLIDASPDVLKCGDERKCTKRNVGGLFRFRKQSPTIVTVDHRVDCTSLDRTQLCTSTSTITAPTPPAHMDDTGDALSCTTNDTEEPSSSTAMNPETDGTDTTEQQSVRQSSFSHKSSGLRRLFESDLFNVDMTLHYIFHNEDPEVKAYLANRLFGFRPADVDFYLPQLVSLYQKSSEMAKYLHPYFLHRCMQSTEFAIHLVWLLDTFCPSQLLDAARAGQMPTTLSRPSSVPNFVPSTRPSPQQASATNPPVLPSSTDPSGRGMPIVCSAQGLQQYGESVVLDGINLSVETDYTAQSLRNVLFPSQVYWQQLFERLGTSSLSSIFPDAERPRKTAGISATLPPIRGSMITSSGRSTGGRDPRSLGHKRAVSDVTSLATYCSLRTLRLPSYPHGPSVPCKAGIAKRQSITDSAWSSCSNDSAVRLSHETTDTQSPPPATIAVATLPKRWHSHSAKAPSADTVAFPIHSDLMGPRRNTDRYSSDEPVVGSGSMASMNRIITREVLMCPLFEARLRTARSLPRLNAADSIQLSDTRTKSSDNNTEQQPHRIAPMTSSRLARVNPTGSQASLSPPDSGLHLTANAEFSTHVHSDRSEVDDEDEMAGVVGVAHSALVVAQPPDSSTGDQSTAMLANDPLALCHLQLRLMPRLLPEWDFVDGLLRLGRRLIPVVSKEQRTAYLQAELANLNLHLPARVWIPVNKADHIVLRIPPTAAVVLNSKDKAPYLIYLEVLACDDPWASALPIRPSGSTRSLTQAPLHPSYGLRSTASHLGACYAQFPYRWQSNTPSSNDAASAIAAPDALSLISTESSNSLEDRCYRPDALPSQCTDDNCHMDHCHHGNTTVDSMMMVSHSLASDQSVASREAPKPPVYVAAGEIRNRLKDQIEHQPHRQFGSDPEDPSAAVLKEPWHVKCQRIRDLSPWGGMPGWHLTAAIVKVGDDLRQEQLAYQLLSVLQRIWQMERVPLWLRPLTVIVTSADSGLIEPVPDTVSLHQIRRHARLSLLDYLLREHGPTNSEAFLTARRNFVQSCAAYCLASYLFQVKDRHNGNILLDNEGHVIHIDYGFMLSASPGKNFGFETSPFKLTAEQVAVMGGVGSDMFEYYKCLLLSGLLAARKHMEQVCVLVEIARDTCPQLPCFSRSSGSTALSGLRQRFQLNRTEAQVQESVERMVESALHSITTKLYDSFQYYTNGIQ